ncbi:hypothetical protein KAR10_07365 [bacterium]|nr:hypothetical protein [bacterium]
MEDYKISLESAQIQIDLLMDFGAVQVEDITSEVLRNAIKSSLNVLRRVIRRGLLEIVVDEKGDLKITQKLARSPETEIVYKEMDGQAKLTMGKVPDDNSYGRAYALLGYLSGLGSDGIARLKGLDLSVAECLGAVFLGI